MAYEYKTTQGLAPGFDRNTGPSDADDPTPPQGEGWELTGGAMNDVHQVWWWKRQTPSVAAALEKNKPKCGLCPRDAKWLRADNSQYACEHHVNHVIAQWRELKTYPWTPKPDGS